MTHLSIQLLFFKLWQIKWASSGFKWRAWNISSENNPKYFLKKNQRMSQITWTIITIKPIAMENSKGSYSFWCWVLKVMKIEMNFVISEDNPSRADAQKTMYQYRTGKWKKPDLFQMWLKSHYILNIQWESPKVSISLWE